MSLNSRRHLLPPAARPSREAGFTLVEALIAIVILVVGIVAVTNLFFVAAASNSLGNATTTAAALASERLDELKAMSFDSLDAFVGPPTTLPPKTVPGVAQFQVETLVVPTGGNTYYIRVRSEPTGGLTARRSRAEFTTFRTCGLAASGQACTSDGDCCSASCSGASLCD